MIIPSFRLYHFAVKLIWKSMLVLTFFFWTGIAVMFYLVNHVAIWVEYGWWLFLMIFGTYFLFMDVRLMVMIMRQYPNSSSKWKVRTGPRNQIQLGSPGGSQLVKRHGHLFVLLLPAPPQADGLGLVPICITKERCSIRLYDTPYTCVMNLGA